MPSPRSPIVRPQSPLSPRFDSSPRFDTLQPPSTSRATHSRNAGNAQRRANTNSLKLPSLPRFHPANYPSSHTSSAQTTPDSGSNSPHGPLSPRAHQRVVSDAQKHLLAYQRETVVAARAPTPTMSVGPVSPRLAPLGSPGPVTPLELEGEEEYLTAGRHSSNAVQSDELVKKLMQEEVNRRRRSNSPARPMSR